MRELWPHYLTCALSHREEAAADVLYRENDIILAYLWL